MTGYAQAHRRTRFTRLREVLRGAFDINGRPMDGFHVLQRLGVSCAMTCERPHVHRFECPGCGYDTPRARVQLTHRVYCNRFWDQVAARDDGADA